MWIECSCQLRKTVHFNRMCAKKIRKRNLCRVMANYKGSRATWLGAKVRDKTDGWQPCRSGRPARDGGRPEEGSSLL